MKGIIYSPYKLSFEEIEEIKKTLKLTDLKLENEVDESLLAGYLIKYEDKIIDLSIKNLLEKFRKNLYEAI